MGQAARMAIWQRTAWAMTAALTVAMPLSAGGKTVTELTASGAFEVKMTPSGAPDAPVGAFTLDKSYHGDLEAQSVGQMLGVRTAVDGSAGYVAMEKVTGTLAGKSGSFILQHSATMARGTPNLSIVVVPDSGTGELSGLAGTMDIQIEGGKHFYSFRYRLGD